MFFRNKKAPIFVLFSLFLLFILALFLRGKTFYLMDISFYFYPVKYFLINALKEKSFFLWNPYVLLGAPYNFDFSGAGFLNPINFILFLSSSSMAFTTFILFYIFLSGVGMYVLDNELVKESKVSFFTGIAYMFSGYLLVQIVHFNIFCFLAWIPLILFASLKAGKKRNLAYIFLCGIVTAFSLTQSQPQIVFYFFLIIGLFLIINFWQEKKRIFFAISGIFLGILFTLPQWLPMVELTHLSIRKGGLTYQEMTSFSLFPYHLLTGIFPHLFGVYPDYIGKPYFWEQYWYSGIAVLFFAVIAISHRRKSPYISFFSFITFTSFILALGKYTPFYHLLYHIKGFNYFRCPARWLSIVNFFLPILAGFGMKIVMESREDTKKTIKNLFYIGFSIIMIGFLFYSSKSFLLPYFKGIIGKMYYKKIPNFGIIKGFGGGETLDYYYNVIEKFFVFLKKSLISFVIIFSSIFCVVFLFLKRKINIKVFSFLIILILTCDLLYHNISINPVRDKKYFLKPSISEKFLLKDKSIYRVHSPENPGEVSLELFGLWGSMRKINSIGTTAYFSLDTKRYEDFKNALEKSEEKKLGKYNERSYLGEKALKILSLLNVKYIIANRRLKDKILILKLKRDIDMLSFQAQPIHYSLHIYENPEYLPRAFIVYKTKKILRKERIIPYILCDKFNPREEVVVENQDAPSPAETSHPLTPAEIISYTNTEVTIRAQLDNPGYLVLSDLYYPGWEVSVDGKKEKIFRVDYLLRGVFLNAGKHEVVFKFVPRPFKIGALISVITLLGVIITGFLIKITKRDEN